MHYYHSEVKFLLVDYFEDKVEIVYDSNSCPRHMPAIGPRPPYYCNPRYDQYYPII